MYNSPYLDQPPRDHDSALSDLISDPAWDQRPPLQRFELVRRGIEAGLDIWTLRSVGWKCSLREAERRLREWLELVRDVPGNLICVEA